MIIIADWASIDGNRPPNIAELKAACVHAGSALGGAIMRGAWGTSPDLTIQRDWRRAQDAGLQVGAYLYLRSSEPPIDQVHAFADHVGALTAADFVPAIDLEDHWTSPQVELEALHAAWTEMRCIYGGVPPMIYDSGRVWVEDLHNLPAGEMTSSPQWVAKPWPSEIHTPAYLSPFAPGAYEPTVPVPWGPKNWWLHQYQGDAFPVPGFSNTVDLSRFHLMYQGEVGARVKWVQARCNLPLTGDFDAPMADALRKFQSTHGLVADAIVGPKTFTQLAWTPPAA